MSTDTQSKVYSSLGGDPDLGELVEMFVDEMPDRIATLCQAFDDGDWESLRRAAHQMKGAAGSYGFSQLTPLAATVETAVAEQEESLEQSLGELIGMCQRLRSGTPA